MGKKKLLNDDSLSGILSSVSSIVIGLIFGYIMLVIFNPARSGNGLWNLISTGLSSPAKLAKVLYQAAPLILTGLSVGFAFKTGLFNIGASGQYTVGAFFALYAGIVLKFPWWAALLCAMVGGAIWGTFPGLFKALFNVNEVITSIMFNWMGLFLVNLSMSNIPQILADYYGASVANRTANMQAANPSAIIPAAGLDKLFGSPYMNISFVIVVAVAVIVYIVIEKTTFGYELKACGFNKKAGMYAGINANRNIVLSMVIAGAISGLAGGIYYLAGTASYTIEKVLLNMGFNGIPVALLANSHPIGTILTGIFISYIQVGGEALQPEYAKEIIDIIIATIIYLSALSLIMKNMIAQKLLNKNHEEKVVDQRYGTELSGKEDDDENIG